MVQTRASCRSVPHETQGQQEDGYLRSRHKSCQQGERQKLFGWDLFSQKITIEFIVEEYASKLNGTVWVEPVLFPRPSLQHIRWAPRKRSIMVSNIK
jgi:hypothetical protein